MLYCARPRLGTCSQPGSDKERSSTDYSAEAAGRATSAWSNTVEQLRHRLEAVDTALDLQRSIPTLTRPERKQVKHFIVDGYQPPKLNGRYPDPVALGRRAQTLFAEGSTHEGAIISRAIREIRTCRKIATGMSGRRVRAAVVVPVDGRLHGKPCARCAAPVRRGQKVYWDRDWGTVWHGAEDCESERVHQERVGGN